MSSIRKYKSSKNERRYSVRYRTPAHEDREKRGFTTLKAAEAFQIEVDSALLKGTYVDPSQGNVRISEWSKIWLNSLADIKVGTLEGYSGNVRKHILPKWGNRDINKIRHSEVQDWVSTLARTLSPSQTRSIFLNFSAMLDYAIKDNRLTANPCVDVRLPRIVKTKKKYLTHEQLWTLADECRTQGDVVIFLGYLGLRFNELAAITVSNVDFNKRKIQIENQLDVKKKRENETRPTKTNEERVVVFPEFTTSMLLERCKGKEAQDYVFTAPKGGPLRLENFRRDYFSPALNTVISKDPSFPKITVHNLRNTSASLAVSSGANIKSLQKMLGHARASMTLDTYAELFDDDVESVAIALNKNALSAIVGKTWANIKI